MVDITTEKRGSETVFSLKGELCRESVEAITDTALRAVAKASPKFVFDMRGVTKIDTTGAGLISAMRRQAE